MELYSYACYKASEVVTKIYSTSFSLGIRAFAPEFRDPIYAVYGYVRFADEIVDSFHQFDKKTLLQRFRNETFVAIEEGISLNPIIQSFAEVVNKYNISHSHITAFLDSMEMDLYNSSYDPATYDKYIFGSAEVVGLMCLRVFVNGDDKSYFSLEDAARALGSAFQKVNFLRDIKSDLEERGRIYLPGIDKHVEINDGNKKLLEETIESEFDKSLEGIKRLPDGVRLGVYSAYMYYYRLFTTIKSKKVSVLLTKRVRVSNVKKLVLLLKSIIDVKILKTC